MSRRIDIRAQFGHRIRQLRQAKGLSQEAFAAECGLDRTYVSGTERGKRNVSLQNIQLLAQALNISVSDLTAGIDSDPRDA